MPYSPPTALASTADTRRRELPAACALALLTGGLAAAITGESFAVFWAGIMALLLIADAEVYRRLDARDAPLGPRAIAGLCAWAFIHSAFYSSLPAALWFDGEPAGAAAAMVLWVAGVVRQFGATGRILPVALAGAAPPALSLLTAPLIIAAATAQPDWDIAVIAAVGGATLMVYVTQARMSATEAERAVRDAAAKTDLQGQLTRLLFESNDVAAVLVDRNGGIMAMSKGAEDRLGAKDAKGRKFEDLILLSPESWKYALSRALEGETVRHAEDEILTTAGRRWFEWEARPWRDADGAVCGALAVARDITSLVEARRVAAANEERFRIALDAGLHVVWEVDYKARKISWFGDVEALYGEAFTFEQFDKNTTTIIHEDDRQGLATYFYDVAAGKGGSVEHRVVKPDGSIGWAQLSARRVLGRSKSVRKLIVISKDITERKLQEAAFIAAMQRAEKALRAKRALFADISETNGDQEISIAASDVSVEDMYEHLEGLMEEMDARDAALADALASLRAARELAENASVSKSQFLASMSHELRTPLNAIIGYAEILQEEAEADGRETDIKDTDRILNAARQLLHLINDILDLSKIEAGRMDVAASDFTVGALIEEAAETLRPAIEKNGNALEVEISGDLGESRSDPFKLNQCLLNLLSNAAKFTEHGKIIVRARRTIEADGDWLEIGVRDTGIGMTEEQVARLFNPFTQAEATTSRKYGGTGLGLALTRRMMQLLGGDVHVKSAEGQGSTFTLRMPARWTDVESAEDAGNGRMALVIDDEESARDLVQRSLTRLGFDVRGAGRGQQGLDLAQAISPDVIVLDINLPDMSGWDVLTALHEAPESAGIPVIVLSIDDDRQRALALGACEHLVKPVDRDVLAAVAARVARAPAPSSSASASAGSPISSIARTA
jgi:PAS domain S-box-containing protein